MDPAYGDIIGITAANQCEYHSDMSFPQRLRLGLRVIHIGKSSARIEAAVYKSDNQNKTGGWNTNGTGALDDYVSLKHSNGNEEWVLAATGR